jgi:tRNA dimethylallyltransferase
MTLAGPPLLVIAGPTATGKTELAIRVAEAVHGRGVCAEIISADSRQVYRGLDIGTAKASAADRARVRHHGLDLADPDASFSVADFVEHARGVLADLAARGGLALLVGGTGFYLRAVASGLDTDALPHDAGIRSRIEAEILGEGLGAAAQRLVALAPMRAARTDLRNPRRVARALEIAELAGDSPPPPARGYPAPLAWLGLDAPDGTHAQWIARRAQAQFDAGLIDEAAALRERWDPALPAFSAIGYREAWGVLDDRLTLDEAIEENIRRNRAFAKRQRTWFRSEPAIRWLDAGLVDEFQTALSVATSLLEERE